jgi:hypothetical protein
MKNKLTAFTNLNWLRTHSRLFGLLTSVDLQLGGNPIYAKAKSFFASRNAPKVTAASTTPRVVTTAQELGLEPFKFDPSAIALPNFVSNVQPVAPGLTGKRLKEVTESRNIGVGWHAILHASNQRFAVTAATIDALQQLCAKQDCKLAVAALPAPNNSMLYFRELDAMKKIAPRSGFTFIDVNAQFPSLAPMQESELYYNIHFTPKGHDRVADVLYRQLKLAESAIR